MIEMPTVLLVEDNDDQTDSLLILFKMWGWRPPICARNLARGIERGSEADVVLLDLGLPDSHGLATLETFLRQRDMPVVVLTGEDDEALEMRAISMGAQDFLPKIGLNEQVLKKSILCAWERHKRILAERKLREAKALVGEIGVDVAKLQEGVQAALVESSSMDEGRGS